MNYLSAFAGIEAATVAWRPLGWRAAAFGEIEPFACAVLAHHYPDTPNRGDVRRHEEWPDAAIDVLAGGPPCQSFSVAGIRKGLDDPRGDLLFTFLAVARRYRPLWVVFENVPGLMSSNGGRDFGAFLGGLAELGYGFAWRVLDAQFFGLAQRRRRVFVVGCAGDWRPPVAVLFERAGLSGYPAPRREARQDVAGTLAARTPGGGGPGTEAGCDGGLIPEVARALTARNERIGAETGTLLVTHALRGEGFDASEDGTGRGTPLVPYTLAICGRSDGRHLEVRDDDLANALVTANGGRDGIGVGALMTPAMQVRRLTPREAERLMGFPDDYTLVPYRGKPAADGPRYRALGNSIAVPVLAWIGRRIAVVDAALELSRP